jgi:hypothetical protein
MREVVPEYGSASSEIVGNRYHNHFEGEMLTKRLVGFEHFRPSYDVGDPYGVSQRVCCPC